jgi:hypothetical protein
MKSSLHNISYTMTSKYQFDPEIIAEKRNAIRETWKPDQQYVVDKLIQNGSMDIIGRARAIRDSLERCNLLRDRLISSGMNPNTLECVRLYDYNLIMPNYARLIYRPNVVDK